MARAFARLRLRRCEFENRTSSIKSLKAENTYRVEGIDAASSPSEADTRVVEKIVGSVNNSCWLFTRVKKSSKWIIGDRKDGASLLKSSIKDLAKFFCWISVNSTCSLAVVVGSSKRARWGSSWILGRAAFLGLYSIEGCLSDNLGSSVSPTERS